MSTHPTRSALSTLLVLATTVATVHAQQTQPSTGPIEASWGMQGDPNQAFKRTCVGDFDNSGVPDLIAVRGSQLEILGDPSLFGWSSGYLGSVLDAATLPNPPGLIGDSVVTVGWNGVQRWSSFEQSDPTTGASAPIIDDLDDSPSEWVGAARVTVGDVEGEAEPRVVGVLSDLRSVRTLVWNVGEQDYDDAALALSPAPAQDILDLALVDFHADGAPELVLMTSTALSVHSLSSGVRLAHYPCSSGWSNACMTVGRPGESIADWVALVVNYVDGVQQFMTIIDGDGPNGLMLLQGNPKVVAMTAGFYKEVVEANAAQDNVDLLLSIESTNKLWVLLNDAEVDEAPVFSLDSLHKQVIVYPSTTTGPQSNQAQPAMMDIDNDGDGDILHAVRLTSSLFVRWNKSKVDDDLYRPGLMYDPENVTIGPYVEPIPESSSLNLFVRVRQPVATPDPSQNPYMELAVFRKDTIESDTHRVADGVWRMPWVQSATDYSFTAELEEPNLSVPSVPPALSDAGRFENFYILMTRVVYRDQNNTTTLSADPAAFLGIETSQGEENWEYIDSLTNDDPVTLNFVCNGCTTYGATVGTITPLPSMPTPPSGPVLVE